MKKETVPVRNSLLLLLTATIWGIAFVAQSVSMDYIGGFTFNSIRSLIGSLTLLPVILLLSKPKSAEEKNRPQTSSNQKILITGGICCGIILCLASNFQQFGIKYTTVGKAAAEVHTASSPAWIPHQLCIFCHTKDNSVLHSIQPPVHPSHLH